MAITIRARKGTQIGYRGTSGGSISWVNQAGQSGRQMAALGNTIINTADDVNKFFNNEVTESEIRQQVDDMQVAYLKQSRGWNKSIREGGSQLDENGIPTVDFDPNHFTNISNQNHDLFWKDQVEDKGYDPKAVSAFGVYFQNKAGEAFNKADQWGMKQRYAKLKAKDNVNVQSHMVTISTDPLVENKQSAFEALTAMSLSGAPHRDAIEWKGIMKNAHSSLVKNIAITNAYGQQGRNLDPSDLVNGYTEQDYTNAIANINKDATLTKKQKKDIVTDMKSNRKTRIAVEKTARATADNATQSGFSALHSSGKLTLSMIENSNIDFKQKMYWKGQLEGGAKKPWKGDYNTIKDTILSGTWSDDNDIVRTPEDVKQAVRTAANEKNIPADEVEKLMKDVDEVAKASPITAKKKSARKHAEKIFKAKLSTFEKLMLGQSNPGLMAKESQAAADNKLWKYDTMIEQELKEGRKNGLTWSKMLSPNSPDYIVNEIIDAINTTEPDIEEIPVVEEEDVSTIDSIIDSLSAVGDYLFSDDDESDGVEHEVYGKKATYKQGVTYEHAKAQVDSQYAQDSYDDPTKRIIYPEEHEGYSQFPEGKETVEAYKKRMKLMGFVK